MTYPAVTSWKCVARDSLVRVSDTSGVWPPVRQSGEAYSNANIMPGMKRSWIWVEEFFAPFLWFDTWREQLLCTLPRLVAPARLQALQAVGTNHVEKVVTTMPLGPAVGPVPGLILKTAGLSMRITHRTKADHFVRGKPASEPTKKQVRKGEKGMSDQLADKNIIPCSDQHYAGVADGEAEGNDVVVDKNVDVELDDEGVERGTGDGLEYASDEEEDDGEDEEEELSSAEEMIDESKLAPPNPGNVLDDTFGGHPIKVKASARCHACGVAGHKWPSCKHKSIEYILAGLLVIPCLDGVPALGRAAQRPALPPAPVAVARPPEAARASVRQSLIAMPVPVAASSTADCCASGTSGGSGCA